MAEKKPIIKLYITSPKEAYYRLSEEELKEASEEAAKNLEEVGGKILVFCDCYWSNEKWVWFGVEEFPDIDALQKREKYKEEHEWLKYVEERCYLGTRSE